MPTPPMAVPSLAASATETTWRIDAACRRHDAVHFYAPPQLEAREEKRARENAARRLCQSCPVQRECLEYSLTVHEPHGIWGGLNELERRRLMRQRASAS